MWDGLMSQEGGGCENASNVQGNHRLNEVKVMTSHVTKKKACALLSPHNDSNLSWFG